LSQIQVTRQPHSKTGQLRNFRFNCIKKGSSTFQQKSTHVNGQLFERYSADLPIGSLEVDSDVSTCEEIMHKDISVKDQDIKNQHQRLPFNTTNILQQKTNKEMTQYHIKSLEK